MKKITEAEKKIQEFVQSNYLLTGQGCTQKEVSVKLNLHYNTIGKYMERLIENGGVTKTGSYFPAEKFIDAHLDFDYEKLYHLYKLLKRRNDSYYMLNFQSNKNIIKRVIISIGEMLHRNISFDDLEEFMEAETIKLEQERDKRRSRRLYLKNAKR